MSEPAVKKPILKYYLVGTTPVRVKFRHVQDEYSPVAAEVQNKTTGEFGIDNRYLGMIDDGEEVKSISEQEFKALTL